MAPPRRRKMETAPRDGSVVLVWLRREPNPLLAHWSVPLHGWLRDDDPQRRVLHGVIGWAPLGSGRRPAQG